MLWVLLYSAGTEYENPNKLLVTMSRMTCFIPRALMGTCITPHNVGRENVL